LYRRFKSFQIVFLKRDLGRQWARTASLVHVAAVAASEARPASVIHVAAVAASEAHPASVIHVAASEARPATVIHVAAVAAFAHGLHFPPCGQTHRKFSQINFLVGKYIFWVGLTRRLSHRGCLTPPLLAEFSSLSSKSIVLKT
jgi:hypothetical protein